MKGVQCYELFGGIALKNHAFLKLDSWLLYTSLPTFKDFSTPAHSMATLGDRSISFASSSSVWNSIPNDVRRDPSLS